MKREGEEATAPVQVVESWVIVLAILIPVVVLLFAAHMYICYRLRKKKNAILFVSHQLIFLLLIFRGVTLGIHYSSRFKKYMFHISFSKYINSYIRRNQLK